MFDREHRFEQTPYDKLPNAVGTFNSFDDRDSQSDMASADRVLQEHIQAYYDRNHMESKGEGEIKVIEDTRERA